MKKIRYIEKGHRYNSVIETDCPYGVNCKVSSSNCRSCPDFKGFVDSDDAIYCNHK